MAELRRIRLEGHLSQDDVALQLHVSRSLVNGWETGRIPPSLDQATAYARLLGREPSLRSLVRAADVPDDITPRQATANRAALEKALEGIGDYEMGGAA
jgi:transcriptional regulator with XRE-family HTH domain